MNKQTLTGFIQKYSLGNNIESVEWNCNNKIQISITRFLKLYVYSVTL